MSEVPAPAGVLVVEDNAGIRKMLGAFFEQTGVPYWSAASGQEALSLFNEHKQNIGVVLCDVQMPEWDGPRTMEELRRVDPTVPVCFMTGDSGNYGVQELLALGAAKVFKKPFESLTAMGIILQQLMRNRP